MAHDAKSVEGNYAGKMSASWKYLFVLVEQGNFAVSSKISCELHAIAGKEEALEWGRFRSGGVKIAGTTYLPPEAQDLSKLFEVMITELTKITDVYDCAISVFLIMARTQFFYDVNKRMGRFMMNGLLLSHGYPVINLPVKRQLEFNQLMLEHSCDRKSFLNHQLPNRIPQYTPCFVLPRTLPFVF